MKKRVFSGRGPYAALTIAVASLNYSLDRVTKLVAAAELKGAAVISLLSGTVRISYIENDGAFLSLGSGWPPAVKYAVFLVIPALCCLYGIIYCCVRESDKVRIALLASIIGGGLGNLIDRLLNDFRVVDFLNFGIGRLRTGILNVADLSVTLGVIALVVHEFARERKSKNTL